MALHDSAAINSRLLACQLFEPLHVLIQPSGFGPLVVVVVVVVVTSASAAGAAASWLTNTVYLSKCCFRNLPAWSVASRGLLSSFHFNLRVKEAVGCASISLPVRTCWSAETHLETNTLNSVDGSINRYLPRAAAAHANLGRTPIATNLSTSVSIQIFPCPPSMGSSNLTLKFK